MSGLSGILVGHVRESSGPLSLTIFAVVEDAFSAKLNGGRCDDSGERRLPIKEPSVERWDLKVAIGSRELGVDEIRHGFCKSIMNAIVNQINNGTLEEDLEGASEVGPDVTRDLDVDVIFIDIDGDIDSLDSRDDTSISEGLSLKLEAEANVDSVHVDFEVPCGNEDPRVAAERVSVELGAKLVGLENEGVVLNVLLKDDVRCTLLNRDVVSVQVVLAITNVWDLEVVEGV